MKHTLTWQIQYKYCDLTRQTHTEMSLCNRVHKAIIEYNFAIKLGCENECQYDTNQKQNFMNVIPATKRQLNRRQMTDGHMCMYTHIHMHLYIEKVPWTKA